MRSWMRGEDWPWELLRWLPVAVAVLGMVLSVLGWTYLVAERRDQIRRMASDVAAQSRRTAAAGVRDHVSALRSLAGFWGVIGRRPVEEWRADAQLLIDNYPDTSYVAWVHPDGRRARVAAGRYETPESVTLEPREAQRLGREARLIGPEPGESGGPTARVLFPVRRGSEDLGVLEARIRLDTLLSRALAESAPGYAIRIQWGDQEIFARDQPTRDAWQDWWHETGQVHLPLGAEWRAVHRPTAELAAMWLDPIPHYLLAVGIGLACALGLITHHLRLNYVRARFLAQGNEALEASAGELRRLNEALEGRVSERTRELEAFTHSISHDLKSPLGAILNFAAILELDYRDRPLDDEGRDILGRIRNSATRGTELLDGLLRLSRAGHTDVRSTRIDMEALARESFAQARQSDPDPDVDFVLDSLPSAVGDRALVREVLVNLFDNALKYSRGQEKRRIVMRGRVDAGESVYEVQDNGHGFDMRFADKLFGLFQRLPSSRPVEGTGVGLALVARIVHRHGGRVWAEGQLDAGARFCFTLPASAETHE